jgi:PAS domain S-box-containing protein
MPDLLRVLLVEDSESDALLLLRRLKADGFETRWERVEDESGFRESLARGGWDLVLADHALPRFSGLAALEIFMAAGLEIPFIIVSGTIGEDVAIEAMKAGAADYFMKDRLARLAPSIRHALDAARARREKKRTDEALRQSFVNWNRTFEAITDSICLLDAEGRTLQCNRAHLRYLGKPAEEVLGKYCYVLVHGTDGFLAHCPFQRMLKSRVHEEEEVVSGDRWFYVAVDPILDEDGNLRGAVHIMSDITEHKRAESELLFKNVLLSTQMETSIDGILVVDENSRILTYNRRFIEMWRLSAKLVEDRVDEPVLSFVADQVVDPATFIRQVQYLYDHRQDTSRDEVFLSDGRVFDRYSAPMSGPDGRYFGRVWYFRDITERKRAEEAFKAALAEKEVLLREIHHRVKNNMQVMISLLNLQAQTVVDPAALNLLKESQNRIRTMAIVHEKLYRSDDLSHIDFADYAESLSVHLFQFFSVAPDSIALVRETETIAMDISHAIPCGLILNELLSNALKHAFPEGRNGRITVGFRRRPDGLLEISVRDDGVGFPAGLDFRKTSTLGLQLVNLLSGQIDGQLEMNRENGTEFRVVFPELKGRPRA